MSTGTELHNLNCDIMFVSKIATFKERFLVEQ